MDFSSGLQTYLSPASGLVGGTGGIGDTIGSLGGVTNGIAKGFTPQNGFQASNPLDQQAFLQAIQQSQGNFNGLQSQQQNLAQALQAQASGQGPNPAQAMLHQATDQNIKQNAGMISSQKGINPALAARLAGQNAGAMSQQAAGQGAVMGAQQQLSAQNQLGSLYGNMTNQNLNNIQGSAGAVNTAVNGVNQINGATAAQNAAATQATAGGILGGLGSAATSFLAHGGYVPHMAKGGMFPGEAASQAIAQTLMQQAGMPTYQSGMVFPDSSPLAKGDSGGGTLPGTPMAGGPFDSLGLPGEESIGGALGPAAMVASRGAIIPGKAKVSGDSLKNDTVPAMLSPGEIVIPRSKAEDPEKAKQFIEHLKKQKNKKDVGYGKVLEAHRNLTESLRECMGGKV